MASLFCTPATQSPTCRHIPIPPRQPSRTTLHLLHFNQTRLAEIPRITPISSSTITDAGPISDSGFKHKKFVHEMRLVAMKLHTKDQAKEGEKESRDRPLSKWKPSIEGYLRFLVDSKLVHDSLESIISTAAFPFYSEFRNLGLERSGCLAKDLEWFKEQGHALPEPSSSGVLYAGYLEELSERDPQAFLCHLYNIYFAHTAGGRIIGKQVSEKILGNKELEFYKWEGELSELLEIFRGKLNKLAETWSREEKDHCLEETEKSFEYSAKILSLITS